MEVELGCRNQRTFCFASKGLLQFLPTGGESQVFNLCGVIITAIQLAWDAYAPGCETAVVSRCSAGQGVNTCAHTCLRMKTTGMFKILLYLPEISPTNGVMMMCFCCAMCNVVVLLCCFFHKVAVRLSTCSLHTVVCVCVCVCEGLPVYTLASSLSTAQ